MQVSTIWLVSHKEKSSAFYNSWGEEETVIDASEMKDYLLLPDLA